MMHWTDGPETASGWMLLCGLLMAVVLLVGAAALIRLASRERDTAHVPEAERELRLRLARGEIGIDEFLRQQDALRR